MKPTLAPGLRRSPLFAGLVCFLAAGLPMLDAQDQSISGNLSVAGALDVYGNTLNFGSWSDDPAKFGLNLAYAEDASHHATLLLTTSRPASGWLWQQAAPNNAAGSVPQMRLSAGNALTLFDQASPTPNAAIVLDPAGTSSFAASATFNGPDNRMPGQTVTGNASVLTVGLADSRYSVHNAGASLAIGIGANANPTTSTAIGASASATSYATTAVGAAATAGGGGSSAYGTGSAAAGLQATALGANASAGGDGAVAAGYYARAGGPGSVALGQASQAPGWNCTAIGNNAYATDAAISLGLNSRAAGGWSVVLGDFSSATAPGATALGYYTNATNDYATALSFEATSSGYNSVALGVSSLASGDNSTALGTGSAAAAFSSSSLGYHASASGVCAVALGNYSTASGVLATALSSSAVASGDYSVAGGNTTAGSYGQFAIGQYSMPGGDPHAWVATDDLFTVGNGTAAAPSNALSVKKNGDTTVGGKLTVVGALIVQPQGDLSMGEFTATPVP